MDKGDVVVINERSPERPSAPDFLSALRFWCKLGFISFGGPAGQIAVMHHELVERRRWISEARFLHALNFCMMLPGPEAQQLATYIGWLLHRTRGGIAAGLLFILPSLLILIGLSWLYVAFGHVPAVAGLFYGIKPAVTAIVIQATYRIGRKTLHGPMLYACAIAAFIALFVFQVPFPLIVLCAGLVGFWGGRVSPSSFQRTGNNGRAQASGLAVLDEDTPVQAHTRFEVGRLARVLGYGLLLWWVPMLLLMYCYGWHGTLTQMGWFFSKAAMLTFGGAYAVLPYVYQGAVEHYQWVTSAQMMDGLALGETTPGPLIMVVSFVGFVGGYAQALFGPEYRFLAGALAATLVTYYTFLPSFIFILVGGPLVEATQGLVGFTAPLTAITAAVVGVIANLALFFAYHVIWPQGLSGSFDALAALITLGASLALMRYRRGVIEVIGVCAVVGLIASQL